MALRCTAKQLAEAIVILSVQKHKKGVFSLEQEGVEKVKPLDLFLSTMSIFRKGFSDNFGPGKKEHELKKLFSKQNFIDYLMPRCLLLAQNNECFDLVLTCAFVFYELCNFTFCECFHLAEVAGEILAQVLEDKFSGMFTNDLDWDELMAYCKKIHFAVLPSRENRPAYDDSSDENADDKENSPTNCIILSKDETGGVTSENKTFKPKFNPEDVESFLASYSKNYDTYWDYYFMDCAVIRDRITESHEHLEKVINALVELKGIEPEQNLSLKCRVSESDYVDIEKLEKIIKSKPNFDEWRISISQEELDEVREELCQQKNEELDDSSQSRIRPEDITDEEIFREYTEMFDWDDEEDFCELCSGKMKAFADKCLEIFYENYSNCDLVSVYFNPSNMHRIVYQDEYP